MPSTRAGRSVGFYVVGLLIVAGAAIAVGYFHVSRDSRVAVARAAQASAIDRGPRVETVSAGQGPEERTIKLLADVRSMKVATLYSKVSGYVKSVSVDRGDMVTAGQVVAQVESPELDQQFASASVDLENKKRNLERSRELLAKGNTTQVSTYQYETDAKVAEANVAVLATNKGYQIVRAPFSGRVTARFVDPGALVTNAQTNFMSSLPFMTISDDSRLRVYAYVQQQDVPFVHVGDRADVVDASNPGRVRAATVTRMTGELDARTRAMQVEVNIDNTDGFLVSGSFAYVQIHVPVQSYPQIPMSGLIVRGEDYFVATLDNDVIRFKPIKVASTDGTVVAVSQGLAKGDKIAVNLPDEVTEGSRVQPLTRTR
jgi:membrane fusion protein (multidrug efflux system)